MATGDNQVNANHNAVGKDMLAPDIPGIQQANQCRGKQKRLKGRDHGNNREQKIPVNLYLPVKSDKDK